VLAFQPPDDRVGHPPSTTPLFFDESASSGLGLETIDPGMPLLSICTSKCTKVQEYAEK
jgi:hypothetical protein